MAAKQAKLEEVRGGDGPDLVVFCHTCSVLIDVEVREHKTHDLSPELTMDDLKHPTTKVLDQIKKDKKEAQYHFTGETLEVIMSTIAKSGAGSVLCIGAPTIYEEVRNKTDKRALLLDIDTRLGAFWSCEDEYVWYNMFNHHFFEDKSAYTAFIEAAEDGLVIVTDPPFGGKSELVSQTLRQITREYQAVHGRPKTPSLLWVFPYFMEHKILGSNPVPGPEIRMSDYQVNYTNHKGFAKMGSPVRIFTNIDLGLLVLPEDKGYKHCGECGFWVSENNAHCEFCDACTSKSGARYRHCIRCQRCVKESWKHCQGCERCALPDHPCGKFRAKRRKLG